LGGENSNNSELVTLKNIDNCQKKLEEDGQRASCPENTLMWRTEKD